MTLPIDVPLAAFDPPEPFEPPTPGRARTLAGVLPANEEAVAAGTVTASGVVPHMISTTDLALNASALTDEDTSAARSSGSADQIDALAVPARSTPGEGATLAGHVGSVIPVASLVHMHDTVDFSRLEADEIGEVRDMVLAAKSNYDALCAKVIKRGDDELLARMKADGGRALPSWEYEINLVEDFTPYAFDDTKLREVMGVLKPADAAKIGRVVPARTVTVPETFERGNTTAILALIKQYGENSAVGKALSAAMSRSRTGEKVLVKRAAPDAKAIDGAMV